MRESIFETVIGAAVVVVAGLFLWFAFARGGEGTAAPSGSAEIGARFSSASGIDRGTDVRMAGVKIGTVRAIKLDAERAEALVTMALSSRLFPMDDGASARIQTDGRLGGNYSSREPGSGFGQIEPCGENQELFGESGCGEILYTQGSVDLLTLFASFANGGGGSSDSGSGSSGSSSDAYPDDSTFGGSSGSQEEAGDETATDAADDTESADSSGSDGNTDSDSEE